jgi:hemolysin III
MHNLEGFLLLLLVWSLAIAGIVLNSISPTKYKAFLIPLYLLMGWIGVLAAYPFIKASPPNQVLLILTGGILYTIGVLFLKFKKLPLNHTVWHLFVMGASLCHFLAIYNL